MESLSRRFAVIVIALLVATSVIPSFVAQTAFGDQSVLDPPECWRIREEVLFTGKITSDNPETVQRVSIYEIHDDDTVNPNHTLTGLGYYTSLTWGGSEDAEWLVLDGDFDSFWINDADHTVTFYGLRNWLHVVYRTHNFVVRPEDQIRFCVIGENSTAWPTQALIRHPANYHILNASPSGYSVPALGEIRWNFGVVSQFQIDASFQGLGPDRPLLDLPIDYVGRDTGSITGFQAAFNRITSKFDHEYPYLTNPNYNCSNPSTGIQHDDRLTDWTGVPKGPPGNVCNTVLTVSSYDGHNGYDFDDRCDSQAPCTDRSAVYPAAQGTIVTSQTGWNNVLGCRVTLDHGNGWITEYGHLQDPAHNHSCSDNPANGLIMPQQRIGSIGSTGTGSGGTTHLHFVVKHDGRVVDPSGWEPDSQTNPDPWSEHPNGASSYPMWLHSIRTTQAFDPSTGGQLASPSHQVRTYARTMLIAGDFNC